jgi:peptidoglycan/LPS O-acetylase OafA/YrhL
MKNRNADGLRGVAALNVALTHFVAAFLPSALHKNYPWIFSANPAPDTAFKVATSPLASLFYNGHFSVLIFFALSGYVLVLPYHGGEQARPVLWRRLCGRYLRLNIPIMAAVLLSFAVYRLGLYSNLQAAPVSGSVVWLKSFFHDGITMSEALRNALYRAIAQGDGTLVPPLWTLKIEFIGSLYVLGFYLLKPRAATPVSMLLAFLLLYAVHREESIYYYVIFFGATFGRIRLDARARLPLLAVGLYFGCFQFESLAYDFLPAIELHGAALWEKKNFYNALGALCLTAAVVQGLGRRFFEHRIVQFLARISFSLYLLHFIVLCSLASWFYLHVPQRPLWLLANVVLYLAVSFLAAHLFEASVDRGAIRLSHRFSAWLFPGRTRAPGTREPRETKDTVAARTDR